MTTREIKLAYKDLPSDPDRCYICGEPHKAYLYVPRISDVKAKGIHGDMVRFSACNKCYGRSDRYPKFTLAQLLEYCKDLEDREPPINLGGPIDSWVSKSTDKTDLVELYLGQQKVTKSKEEWAKIITQLIQRNSQIESYLQKAKKILRDLDPSFGT
jgi:hypothetical protein